MAFSLDTSGRVLALPTAPHVAPAYCWTDLSPFAQGYFTEQARTLWESLDADVREAMERGGFSLAFTDWSTEALALILKDCEAMQSHLQIASNFSGGRVAWEARKTDWKDWGTAQRTTWPPLTPYLSDDGKIHLRAAA